MKRNNSIARLNTEKRPEAALIVAKDDGGSLAIGAGGALAAFSVLTLTLGNFRKNNS